MGGEGEGGGGVRGGGGGGGRGRESGRDRGGGTQREPRIEKCGILSFTLVHVERRKGEEKKKRGETS